MNGFIPKPLNFKQLSNTMANPRDPEDIDNGTKNDHAIDSFRYGVMWREYPVRCPETEEADRVGKKYVPTWMKNKGDGETKWI